MGFAISAARSPKSPDALAEQRVMDACTALARWSGQSTSELEVNEIAGVTIEQGVIDSYRHVFATMFWFAVLPARWALCYTVSPAFFSKSGHARQPVWRFVWPLCLPCARNPGLVAHPADRAELCHHGRPLKTPYCWRAQGASLGPLRLRHCWPVPPAPLGIAGRPAAPDYTNQVPPLNWAWATTPTRAT